MKTQARPIPSILATAIGITLSFAATASFADAPQAVTITTQVVFNPDTDGTFVATGPICSTGTVSLVKIVIPEKSPNVNAVHRFTCDDNSGSFNIRLHPQFNARPKENGFDANGPWSVWGKGTGDYSRLSGYGDFGVVVDEESDPLEATETYVGFVTLN